MSEQAKVNPLLESSTPLFALVSPFRATDRGASLPISYRENILVGFNELERLAFESKISIKVLEDVRYAMAAYVDEVVLTSLWPGRLEWMAQPLQLEFFGEHLAGEGFFKKLMALRQNSKPNADALELYYVCLQLGFEGVYRMQGLEQLLALQVDLRSQIESYRKITTKRLSPTGVPTETLLAKVRAEIPLWVVATFTLASVFFSYIGYSYVTEKVSRKSLATISYLQTEIDVFSTNESAQFLLEDSQR